jgi:poly-gamma-glutamate synthesis protein (capsule biosynthesis protein)
MTRLLALGAALLLLWGCRSEPSEPPRSESERITLVAVGDILMHQDVKTAAHHQGGFEKLWEDVTPLFLRADIVFGNLETPIAPLIGKPGEPYVFNAPADLPDALRRSGFAVLSTANNHAYDQGAHGHLETLTHLEVANLVAVGSGRGRAEAEVPRILTRQGIRIAFLAWTDLFNLQFNREGKGPWVNGLDGAQAIASVQAARSQADVVVVSVHWGIEDQHKPTERQREMATRLLEAGADLILGHHPHVLQPLETREIQGRPVAVAYSLGNFISNQNRIYQAAHMPLAAGDERDGAALVATFQREPGGEVTLQEVGYSPLWTENNWHDIRAGRTDRRDIRVVRLDMPERMGEPWDLRRERIQEIMGPMRGR